MAARNTAGRATGRIEHALEQLSGDQSVSEEQTQYQTAGAQSTSKQLSMQATTPPAEVPGVRLQRFLGSGAFGQVWVGQDTNTGRSVAVKFYLHRGGVNWSLLSREVKNLVQLSADRHVVQVLEVGWNADPPYYVMEFVSGGSLEDLLKARGRLPVSEAVEIFRKICTGLNHCHSKGVLHCDVKPANVLMAEDHEPRLADFGQSRMSHDQAPALGTLFYMAPEQADLQSTPDASWDVYAAGAILYRMLTGTPPHRGDALISQIDTAGSLPKRLARYREAISNSPRPEGHLQRRGVDRSLGRIINKCLAVDPKDRYANVQQILQDLERREQTRSRRPLMLLGIVGPLLLLMATCIFAARSIERASTSTQEALRKEAFGSNQLAAKFAARSLEGEIQRYFDLTGEEAQRDEFREVLQETLRSPSVSQRLDEIASAGTPAAAAEKTEARQQLLSSPQRLELDQYLATRLARYTDLADDSRRPSLATMFVTDARGTFVAIAYDDPVERSRDSAGRNFAYRSYFHGGRNDLPTDTPLQTIEPLSSTHLSAAFQSTATGLWKVAVSTPIYLGEDRDQPDAVFVVTINLGDFKLLQSEQGANQVAVLIEAREGPLRGTVLQHPLMDVRREQGKTLAGEKFQVSEPLLQRLLAGGDVDYLDPMAEADDGEAYSGPWIAAVQPVALPDDSPAEQAPQATTDLLVLVQYRLAKIFAPVGQMRSSLLREGAAAVASILLVTFSLWILVLRASDPRSDFDEPPSERKGVTDTVPVR